MKGQTSGGAGERIKIAVGSDHAGFALKQHVAQYVTSLGHEVDDMGTFSSESVDYTDFGLAAARAVAEGRADRAILICHTGIGMSIAANKVRGVRAALCRDRESARLSRVHNNANVLVLAAAFTKPVEAEEFVRVWLQTEFEGGRHERRIGKISAYETPGFWLHHGQRTREVDPRLKELMDRERARQNETLTLVASEGIADTAIFETTGSLFTLKYAEGYPGARLYPGCRVVDEVETLARDRAKTLFGADHANVQPYSGTQANMAAYFALLKPGQKILGMRFDHGGHPTHGDPETFAGRLYGSLMYGVKRETELIDYEEVERLATKERPNLIIAGGSAYSRFVDFARFRSIADACGARLMVDMAHLSGIVAAGIHPSPVPFADVMTSTTHKTLLGPRGGLILARKEHAPAVDDAVFPVVQGGPLMHAIAAKAACFGLALRPEFRQFQLAVIENARALAAALEKLGHRILAGGTDTHLFVADIGRLGVDASAAWNWLEDAGLLVNACAVPFDTKFQAGGIRVGTLSATGRGMKVEEMGEVARLIDACVRKGSDPSENAKVRAGVRELCARFPAY
ncbi:MAG: ribose 5-phosphate isomerase B [Candidatus Eisenbacteria bacterium]|nr:ribose 5-phosphate isomerase B [Candidatus Eisenbacteria bacterium]